VQTDQRTAGRPIALVRYFFRAYPLQSTVMLLALLAAGIAEGFGVASLLPLIAVATSDSAAPGDDQGTLYQVVASLHYLVGLEMTLGSLLILTVGGMASKAAFMLIGMRQVGYTVAHVVTDFRLALVRALMGANWEYFIRQPAGRFANAYGSEAERAGMAYYSMTQFLALSIQVFLYLAVALAISWQTSIAGAGVGLLLIVIFHRMIQIARSTGSRQTRLLNSLVSRLSEGLNGMKAIKAMGNEDCLGPMLEHETRELNQVLQRQVLTREALNSLQEPLIVIFLAVGMYGAVMWWSIPFASLLVMGVMFHRIVSRVASMQRIYHNFSVAESAFWSLRSAIESAEKVAEVSGSRPAPSLQEQIEFRGVSFDYDGKRVLDDASFTLPARSLIAVVGRSGSGKTTLLDLLLLLHKPRHGEILVDGVTLAELDIASWRHRIGYVPQETLLFNDTIMHNVTLGDEIPAAMVREALELAGAWEFIGALPHGLDTPVGEKGLMVSGGQRQRIAIARAIVRNPALLILDEATSGLDVRTEVEVAAALRRLTSRMTVIAVSHQPAIVDVADYHLELKDGRIIGRKHIRGSSVGALS
jgi:ATP-binding cassette, subfamily C, bacterial